MPDGWRRLGRAGLWVPNGLQLGRAGLARQQSAGGSGAWTSPDDFSNILVRVQASEATVSGADLIDWTNTGSIGGAMLPGFGGQFPYAGQTDVGQRLATFVYPSDSLVSDQPAASFAPMNGTNEMVIWWFGYLWRNGFGATFSALGTASGNIGSRGFRLAISGGQIQLGFCDGGALIYSASGLPSMQTGWHLVAIHVRQTGGLPEVDVYIDGVLIPALSGSFTGAPSSNAPAFPLAVNQQPGAAGSNTPNGHFIEAGCALDSMPDPMVMWDWFRDLAKPPVVTSFADDFGGVAGGGQASAPIGAGWARNDQYDNNTGLWLWNTGDAIDFAERVDGRARLGVNNNAGNGGEGKSLVWLTGGNDYRGRIYYRRMTPPFDVAISCRIGTPGNPAATNPSWISGAWYLFGYLQCRHPNMTGLYEHLAIGARGGIYTAEWKQRYGWVSPTSVGGVSQGDVGAFASGVPVGSMRVHVDAGGNRQWYWSEDSDPNTATWSDASAIGFTSVTGLNPSLLDDEGTMAVGFGT